ncbi:MAG: bifunctional diaminohydroxyphosphoribosylaminopyrimidine deaminase/5-amino-6-(5-phosphoribosylamino)uracil reductase RibD, partial [Rickettsiales bacterium]|nr:bifunctional diaminohydroxyphosphoribosylaminopyrimidine deaminase/5-amino-6-(5-phosphoribosylamino)uracil reductase RibD [Rickettsiales bacterium]
MQHSSDIHFLHHALRVAARGLGRTSPNPSVGCVLVKHNTVLAATLTADGGRPHAETQALAIAGATARGATAYVTLEPCAHTGQTPPCAQALIAAGIARVVIAETDPDPRVAGKGIAMLRAAGIEVSLLTTHHSPLTDLNRGFFRRLAHGLPHVAMKLATSTDYFMARGDGGGQWITGEVARAHGNQLRGQYDCVLTGIGTVLADNPQMNVRAPNLPHPNLIRVVADRQLRLPLTSHLVKTANQQPTWVITSAEAVELAASHATELREAGVKFLVMEDATLPPRAILQVLAGEGITRLLIEAGPALS